MRRLIINADDLGINQQRSHGIFLCQEQGVLTSASLMPNGSDSDRAARYADERDLPTGLHLNLTTYSPLGRAADIRSLLTVDGYFLGRDTLERILGEGEVEPVHIEREIRSQVEWFLEHRGQPTHVDGHHHIHIHPVIAPILISILDRYGISFVRIPSEPAVPFGFPIEPSQSKYIEKISARADAARKVFEAHGIRSTDNFRGMALVGNASNRNMRHTLGRLPEGTTELMTHPGSHNPSGEPFDADPQRQTEVNVLLNPELKTELKEREISLCSYADLY
jgi:predicted glycoside hydrolase/deacetylase ChbG (UPF0249 family)